MDECQKQKYQNLFSTQMPAKTDIVKKMARYGYDTSQADTDTGYQKLTQAVQYHFRQDKYDGVMDAETAAVLYALIDRYFPSQG